ncbi:MAG: phosphopantetheine adenylyltransferase [Candidatus Binatia bacterium]
MSEIAGGLFLLVGIGNLIPMLGVLSAERLETLYGVRIREANLLILMEHRAVLLGIIGSLLVAAAFDASLRVVGLLAGLASMVSFVAVAHRIGEYNELLKRVVLIDVGASVLLLVAGVLDLVA